MTPERWKSIQDLFHLVLDAPADERTTVLEQACAGDADLRKEVESLLAAEAHPPEILQSTSVRAPAQHPEDAVLPDHTIGPYRILCKLGDGGMGTVYLAERADGSFSQTVALKLIKRGMDSESIVRRFLHEREVLASLRHPNIANLLDGGTAADGRPFFAMEYVEGEPITTYCDARKLGIEARLHLFQDVCAAVNYAHQNLVVHRDLKPSNMLVSMGDDTASNGVVKLLDFGIARVLTPDQESTMLTRTGMRVMTPAYASPEQLNGNPVSTVSDVYALGIVLYELLTGKRPETYRSGGERNIIPLEPGKPSSAVTDQVQDQETNEQISSARATTNERLRKRLTGDLDTICLKALQTEPQRRYASAEALAEDIRRHLAGLPVLAQRDTYGYRTGKYIRRNLGRVVTTLVLALLVVGFALFYTVQITQERDLARQEATKSAQVSAFLIDLFDVSDPDRSKGEQLTAEHLLERGTAKIESTLADQPTVRADLLDVLGHVYFKMGKYEPALTHYEEALALRQTHLGMEDAKTVQSLTRMGHVFNALARHEESEQLYQKAVTQARLIGVDTLIADALIGLEVQLRKRGDFDNAEQAAREALTLRQAVYGPDAPQTAEVFHTLGTTLWKNGTYDEAEALMRQAIQVMQRAYGLKYTRTLIIRNDLSVLLREQDKLEEAETLIRENLEAERLIYGREHPHVARTLNNLALLLRSRAKYAEAIAALDESLTINLKTFGEEHSSIAIRYHNMGFVYAGWEKVEEAEAHYRKALALKTKLYGQGHVQLGSTQGNLANVLVDKGAYDEATTLLRDAITVYRRIYTKPHRRLADALAWLGRAHVKRNRNLGEAETLLREALDMRREIYTESHPKVAYVVRHLAACLSAQQRPAEADALLQEMLTLLEQERGPDDAETIKIREQRAQLQQTQQEAIP